MLCPRGNVTEIESVFIYDIHSKIENEYDL